MYGFDAITPLETEQYCEQHSSAESSVLAELNRETHLKVMQPRMLSGHLQGRLLSAISKMIKPQNILEIGTYTGYSAICLAEGLAENGHLTTIEVNEERKAIIQKYIQLSGNENKINLHIGSALDIVPKLNTDFDLIFVDADKENYPRYYDLAIEKLKSGGWILFDNMLWSGKVCKPEEVMRDKDTRILNALNAHIQADVRVENILLPIRDGLMLVRKK